MEIKIIKKENEIVVKAANKKLEIKENSETWNSREINAFLVAIATKDSENKLAIIYDENEKNAQYKWLVELFKTFKKNYEEN